MKRFAIKKNIIAIIIACIIFLMVVTVAIPIGIRYKEISTIRHGKFISSLWDKYPNYRHYMIEDMESEIDIWNLSRDEIIELLGVNGMSATETHIFYTIKRFRLSSIAEGYGIKFMDNGRVEHTYIYEFTGGILGYWIG